MGDVLKTASDWLGGMFKTHASQQVVYRLGASSVSVLATIGKSTFEVTDVNGLVQQIQTRDYLVAVADLILDGAPVRPTAGARFEEGSGDVYEVMPVANEPAWTFSDPYGATYRIHTKPVIET